MHTIPPLLIKKFAGEELDYFSRFEKVLLLWKIWQSQKNGINLDFSNLIILLQGKGISSL